MHRRDVDPALSQGPAGDAQAEGPPPSPAFADLVFRTPPNWTAVGFLGMLGGLHLAIAIPAFLHHRWEGFLSLGFGCIFVVCSVVCSRCRFELAVLASQRRIRLRHGLSRCAFERFIPFPAVRAVRLTLSNQVKRNRPESRIELLCPYEDVECPPTAIPRQEALFLAMALNVPLVKVSDDSVTSVAPDGEAWPQRN
jgi:hypothetical protein